jgi:hypothetical protein
MPGFVIDLVGPYETRVWTDPASDDLPSRIAPTDLQQHRHIRVSVYSSGVIQFRATLDGESGPVDDATGGPFLTRCEEFPGPAAPSQSEPTPGTSAIVDVTLENIGHYTISMEHLADPSGPTRGRGKVFVHIDVESTA